MWYRCKATCTHWLIDIMGCRVARPTPPPPPPPPLTRLHQRRDGCVLRKQAGAKRAFSFPGRAAGLIGRWLLATQDSFNKNTSRFTLIIHRPRFPPLPTATGAIKRCSSVNESTIWSSYLFVNSECPALVMIAAAGVLQSRCFSAT